MPPQMTGSLQRRVMLILLILATIPGYVALMLSSYTASRTIRANARDQTYEMAQGLARDIDIALSKRVSGIQELTRDEDLVLQLQQYADQAVRSEETPSTIKWDEPLELREYELHQAQLLLVGRRGRILGQLTADGIAPCKAPPQLEGSPLIEWLAGDLPSGAFISEMVYQDWTDPHILIGNKLPGTRADSERLVLVGLIPLNPIFQSAERLNPSLGQRLVVLSRSAGVVYSTQKDSDFEVGVGTLGDRIFSPTDEETDDNDLLTLEVRSLRLGVAHALLRIPRSYSNQGSNINPVNWAIVQTVDLEEILSTLRREVWTAIIVGLLLTIVAVALSIWVSKRMVEPVLKLTEGMQQFAQGYLDYRVEVKTGNELEVLANAANEMAESLKDSYLDLANRMTELDEKATQLELIHSISHSVNRALDLDKLFRRIIKEILMHVPCERVELTLLNESRDGLTLDYVYPNDRETLPQGTTVPLHGSVMGRALKDQVLTLRKLRDSGKYYEDTELTKTGMRVICVVPLVATNGAVGTLNLASVNDNCFGQSEIKLLERIADSLGLAVEHGRLYMRVAQFASELEETVQLRTKELQAAQAKLVQTEKFAATGSIAAHIGHEVNNPLSIIKNYLKIVSGRMAKPNPAEDDLKTTREAMQIIEEEIDRIARIISQLRMVSKSPAKAELTDIHLNDELKKLAEMFEGTMRKQHIEIDMDFDDSLEIVTVCRDYLRQIIINLMRNAMDALEDSQGGIITLRTKSKPDEKKFIIEVQDTGPGIPAEYLSSVFDPFFTTKTEGKGTGLGLSVSFGLAQTMGGILEAESKKDEGATIRLVLPLTPKTGKKMRDDESIPEEKDTSAKTGEDSAIVRRRGSKIIIG